MLETTEVGMTPNGDVVIVQQGQKPHESWYRLSPPGVDHTRIVTTLDSATLETINQERITWAELQ